MSDDYVERNRALWTKTNQQYTGGDAERSWASEITWGVWEVPEADLAVIGDVAGLDAIELGCGTAYFSSWLARAGARVVGVDVTEAQLATARACQLKFGLSFPLIEANAEHVPLADASFDLALSEYGASLWCDPARWIPEAARLLRPGGRLVFLTNSPLLALCLPDDEDSPAGTQLLRSQADARRMRGADGSVEFHPSHGEWIRVLRDSGFTIERLIELHAHPKAVEHTFYKIASVEWAQRWPAEDLWIARKLGASPQ
jgi:ubiquinone/menaquinone biosynthesis C-methylase UbiE